MLRLALPAVLLVACNSPFPAPLAAAHADEATPRRGGTLQLGSFADVRALDPAVSSDELAASVIEQVFAGLVDYDASAQIVPDLARRFELSSDGLAYTFFLREGVRFHDGSEVTAADIKRSIERALHPTPPNPSASLYDTILAEHLATNRQSVGDVPGAAGSDDVLHIRLEKVSPVAKTK